jgi:D-alanyl-lipoteichoic acid acyltransferase DltB (MBOAT superfamily)
MLFNSYEFIFAVLPASLLGYFLLGARSGRLAIWWLVAVSIVFYAWWRPANLPIFLGSILINFLAGRYLNGSGAHRKLVLMASVLLNLGLLGLFKYSDFAIANFNQAFGAHFALPAFVLPLGISFFTFTQITYLVDTFRRRGAGHPLPDYALFVSFYPHLLAGPILHHQEMLPQFAEPRNSRPQLDHLWRGL